MDKLVVFPVHGSGYRGSDSFPFLGQPGQFLGQHNQLFLSLAKKVFYPAILLLDPAYFLFKRNLECFNVYHLGDNFFLQAFF
ncbi:MAG TPA: hypothetical protein VLH40_08160 [Atribacteraceae bacterium]|nr:hypothetical protein [Atribacteraceae bacterium]